MSRRPFLPTLLFSTSGALISFDITAVTVALPTIGRELDFGMAGFAWVMDAYSMMLSGLLLAAGALTDRYGKRQAAMVGNALFAVASLACGLADNGPVLWAARGVQGMGSALAITGGLALLSGAFPAGPERARAFALVGMVGGAAMAAGPTVGGLITSTIGWRWIFLINLPICAALGWAMRRQLAEQPTQEPRPLDGAGVTLLTLALGSGIALLLAQGPVRLIWAGSALALLAGFVLQQRRRPVKLIEPGLIARRDVLGICAILLALSLGYWADLVYLPLYLNARFGVTPDQAGPILLLSTLPMLLLPTFGARVAQRLAWQRFFAIGLLGIVAGNLCLTLAGTFPAALAALALLGLGAGLVNAQASATLVALAPPEQAGMASAIATLMRQSGFAIGIALLGGLIGDNPFDDGSPSGFSAGFLTAGGLAGAVALYCLVTPVRRPQSHNA